MPPSAPEARERQRMSVPEVVVHHDASLLARAVAARLLTALVDSAAARGSASVVLTGGGIGTAGVGELALAPPRAPLHSPPLATLWRSQRLLPPPPPHPP